ncbi:MAG: ATP-binding protein, partial [Raoultibacter sp.]
MDRRIFEYPEEATHYLKAHDKRLGAVIDAVGPIRRAVDADLFSSLVNSIVGQQISTKAHQTIWTRMLDELAIGRADGRYMKLLKHLAKIDVLVIDDWGLAVL